MILLWNRVGTTLSSVEIQQSFDYYKEYLHATKDFEELNAQPKRHMVVHLTAKIILLEIRRAMLVG